MRVLLTLFTVSTYLSNRQRLVATFADTRGSNEQMHHPAPTQQVVTSFNMFNHVWWWDGFGNILKPAPGLIFILEMFLCSVRVRGLTPGGHALIHSWYVFICSNKSRLEKKQCEIMFLPVHTQLKTSLWLSGPLFNLEHVSFFLLSNYFHHN